MSWSASISGPRRRRCSSRSSTTWRMLVQERGLARESVSIPSKCPVVIAVLHVVDRRAGDPRSCSRLRSRRRQWNCAAAIDICRAAQIGTAAVSPSSRIDDADIPSIANLSVRAALSPVWRAAICAALVAFDTVAPVRAAGPPNLDAAADGVVGVAAGTGACGTATDAVRLGQAVRRAGTAL